MKKTKTRSMTKTHAHAGHHEAGEPSAYPFVTHTVPNNGDTNYPGEHPFVPRAFNFSFFFFL